MHLQTQGTVGTSISLRCNYREYGDTRQGDVKGSFGKSTGPLNGPPVQCFLKTYYYVILFRE